MCPAAATLEACTASIEEILLAVMRPVDPQATLIFSSARVKCNVFPSRTHPYLAPLELSTYPGHTSTSHLFVLNVHVLAGSASTGAPFGTTETILGEFR